MSALIDYHSMNDIYEKYNNTVIETIELVLSNHKFDKFRDIFYALLNDEEENISIIENFEKEYNLTIIRTLVKFFKFLTGSANLELISFNGLYFNKIRS